MKTLKTILASVALAIAMSVQAHDIPYTDTFFLSDCRLGPEGVNNYFMPLKPGSYLLFQGEDDGETETLLISVLERTKVVAGVNCAVVREMEWAGDELVEISWNYFAICHKCDDIFYFGEDVNIYEDGRVVSHDGAWLAGRKGAKPGLIMPGRPLNGSRYYQEVAPNVALDRAEHLNDKVTVQTPAGTFNNCLYVSETTPLEPRSVSTKYYARGVGLIQDGVLKLIEHGSNFQWEDFELNDD